MGAAATYAQECPCLVGCLTSLLCLSRDATSSGYNRKGIASVYFCLFMCLSCVALRPVSTHLERLFTDFCHYLLPHLPVILGIASVYFCSLICLLSCGAACLYTSKGYQFLSLSFHSFACYPVRYLCLFLFTYMSPVLRQDLSVHISKVYRVLSYLFTRLPVIVWVTFVYLYSLICLSCVVVRPVCTHL